MQRLGRSCYYIKILMLAINRSWISANESFKLNEGIECTLIVLTASSYTIFMLCFKQRCGCWFVPSRLLSSLNINEGSASASTKGDDPLRSAFPSFIQTPSTAAADLKRRLGTSQMWLAVGSRQHILDIFTLENEIIPYLLAVPAAVMFNHVQSCAIMTITRTTKNPNAIRDTPNGNA